MKKVLLIFCTTLALIVAIIVGWRAHLSSPSGWNWKDCDLTQKVSFWPAQSQYDVRWNGMSVKVHGQPLAENKWLDCYIWNGSGIDSLKIFVIDDGKEKLVYPGEEADRSLSAFPDNSPILGFMAIVGSNLSTPGAQKFHVSLSPLEKGISKMHLIVYDSNGNIAEKKLEVPVDSTGINDPPKDISKTV